MNKSALFSNDRTQRYLLTRVWDESLPMATCIGLNPSNANESKDDLTIRVLCTVLKNHGYGGLFMTNLYSVVTSDPKKLRELYTNVRGNEMWISDAAERSKDVIFCWGDFSQAYFPATRIKRLFPNALCFGKTKSGAPKHPRALQYGSLNKTGLLNKFNSLTTPTATL